MKGDAMSFTDFDFPHTHFYESDLRELIAMYKKLVEEYNGIVADIQAIKEWEEEHKGEYQELVRRLNSVENEINTFEQHVQNEFDALEASLNTKFNNLAEEIRLELQATVNEINKLFRELRTQLEEEIAKIRVDIALMKAELEEAMADFRIEMIEYLDRRFDEFIANLPDYENLIVHNPIRGYGTTIQVAIDDLYSHSNVFGLTAKEFDSLELTCEDFEGYELTAYEFDNLGYKLLNYPDPNYYMLDPFSGEVIPVKDVVMKLYGLHAGGVTAEYFDALDLTAEEFDNKETTAFVFDFYGISA